MRKAIEHAKQKKEHELRFSDEGITELSATYPELCKNNKYNFVKLLTVP